MEGYFTFQWRGGVVFQMRLGLLFKWGGGWGQCAMGGTSVLMGGLSEKFVGWGGCVPPHAPTHYRKP